jgi:hypothetical protein
MQMKFYHTVSARKVLGVQLELSIKVKVEPLQVISVGLIKFTPATTGGTSDMLPSDAKNDFLKLSIANTTRNF